MTRYKKRKVFTQGNSLCVTIPAKLKDTFPEGTEVTPILTAKGLLFTLKDTSAIEQPELRTQPQTPQKKPNIIVDLQPATQQPLKPSPVVKPEPEPVEPRETTSFREPIASRFLGNLLNLGTRKLRERGQKKKKKETEYCI